MVSFKQRSGNSFYAFTLVLATALTILFTVGTSTAEAQSGRFAMVFATGGLGDQSFNDSAFAGVQSARERFGVEFDWAEPTSVAEYEALLTRFTQHGNCNLIISIGFDQADAVTAVAARFPGNDLPSSTRWPKATTSRRTCIGRPSAAFCWAPSPG